MSSEPCIMTHTVPNRHENACPCNTDHETTHDGHCNGCLPATASIGLWCGWHYNRTRDKLTQIPDLTAQIAASPTGTIARIHSGGDTTRRATKVDQASPSQAWDTADDVVWWAHTWAETIADHLRHTGPFKYNRAGLPVRALTASITYLTAHLPAAAAEPYFAKDLATDTERLHRSLELAAGQDHLVHRLRNRCPSCDHKSLIREDGAGQVECRNPDCRRIWLEAEYATLAQVAAL